MESLQVLAGTRDVLKDGDFFVPFLNWNTSQKTKLLTITTSNLKIPNSLVFRQLFFVFKNETNPEEETVFEAEKRLDIYSRGVHNVDTFRSAHIVIDSRA